MKIHIIAAVSWAAGAVLGFLLACTLLRKILSQRRRRQKKKIGTMDKILVLEAFFLLAYTVADFIVFWHTSAEPATLTACVFGVCGMENGVMGWIKTNKDKAAQNAPEPPPETPPAGEE